MDDLDFNPYASKRVDQERPEGPFKIREALPEKIQLWRNRIHPETKKVQKLIDFDWQRVGAERIIRSFETHVQDWTLKAVKKREALDKADNRDFAQSLFATDRNGIFLANGLALRLLRIIPPPTATPNQINTAAIGTRIAQAQAITVLIGGPLSPIVAADQPVLLSYCDLTVGEFQIFRTFLKVFNDAQCHFFFDIVSVEMTRFLNAERIANLSATPRVVLTWPQYRSLALSRMTDTKESEDLLTYLTKVRDEGLPIYLWVAERRAERDLLVRDGITFPESVWLSFVLDFTTNEERIILQVPAEKDLASFNAGAGYLMTTLEASISTTDP